MEMDSSALSETGLEETCVFMDDLFDEDELADLQRSLEAALAAPAPPEPTKKTKSSGSTRKKLCKGSSAPIVLSFGKRKPQPRLRVRKTAESGLLSRHMTTLSLNVSAGSCWASVSLLSPPLFPASRKFVCLLKHLQEQVQILEEKAENQSRDWGVLVRKSLIDGFGKNRGREDMNEEEEEQALPAVEARIKEHEVVVRIQCEIQKGVLANLLREVEDLHLAVVTANLTALGGLALDITINAEMEKEFNATGIEVATRLGAAIQRLAHRSPCEE